MWRIFLMALAIFAFTLTSFGDDKKAYQREIVINGTSFPNSMIILVDCSGSMEGPKYGQAVRAAMWVARQAGDDGKIKIVIFSSATRWWTPPEKDREGKSRNTEGGWLRLPDGDGLTSAETWLKSWGPAGGTAMADSMEEVLSVDPEDPIGIIAISDEDFDEGTTNTIERITKANALRKSRATIGVIGICPNPAVEEFGVFMANDTGGAYVKISKKEPVQDVAPSGK